MRLIKKYFDLIFMLIATIVLLIETENGILEKLAKFEFVVILAAYYFGKYIARWQQKA